MKRIFIVFCALFCMAASAELVPVSSLSGDGFSLYLQTRDKPTIYDDSLEVSNISQLNASIGETYVYQLLVCAKDSLDNITLSLSPLQSVNSTIDLMTCYNMYGIDSRGNKFIKNISVPAGHLQALWVGVDLSKALPGVYKGSVTVTSGSISKTLPITLSVDSKVVDNHGYNEGWRLSRLDWLNSTIAQNDSITRGYIPVGREGNVLSILGRTVTLGKNGLPSSIDTYFTESNQSIKNTAEHILASSMDFVVESAEGPQQLKHSPIKYTSYGLSSVSWQLTSRSADVKIETSARLEYDGFMRYEMTVTALRDCSLKDIRLQTPFTQDKSTYTMGLGKEGGLRNGNVDWKWDVTKNQDMLWVGAVNGGLRLKWMDENYRRPLINVYYHYGELLEPASWSNKGAGGITLTDRKSDVMLSAYSGPRTIRKGEQLHYNFEMLITPFRTVNKHKMFADRYFHGGGSDDNARVAMAKEVGANVINVHHAGSLYPFINYPYLDENVRELKNIIDIAHHNGMRMKFYYTTREITKNIPEFWAFNSLKGEIIFPGPGNEAKSVVNPSGPDPWLKQYLRKDYIAAWHNNIDLGIFKGEKDLSVITTPDSRLNNFYIAGLDFMVRKMGLDGVYIDDSALDRYTIRRARKVIDAYRPEGRMDFHSWNHLCDVAGQASCLNMYMDLLPYFDLCWIGEGRNYDHPADNWLIEVSGIPFGLSGQMLQGGGNAARGMVYGMTNRPGWGGPDASRFWKFWDKYRIESKEMIGYWDKRCPVHSDNPNVSATIFHGNGSSIIAVAAWGENDTSATLTLDFPYRHAFMPAIDAFQDEKEVDLSKPIEFPKGGGYLIIVEH